MSKWKLTSLESVTEVITKGTTPPADQFATTGIRFLKVESILGDGRIDLTRTAHVSGHSHIGTLRRSMLKESDVLFSIAGTIGRTAIMEESLLPANTNQAVAILRPNTDLVEPRYLFYALRDQARVQSAISRTIQSVQANLSLAELSRITIPLPPRSDQRRIVEVLGALDDKIAANTALGLAATRLASSEFASLVRGIDAGPSFDQIATVSGGGTPSTANPDFWGGGVSWATPTDMTALSAPYLGATSRSISEAGLAACSSKLFEPGAILMTSRATIGAIAVNTIATAVNQGFIVVEPLDDRLRWWLFHEMASRVDEFISWANGATFLELSRGNFKRLPVRLPPDGVVDSFAARASALHDRARVAMEENRTLAATRDALLPQLMSGKLRVRDAEAIAADAGA